MGAGCFARDLLGSLSTGANGCCFCGSGDCTFTPEPVGSCVSEDSGHVVAFESYGWWA